MSINNFEIAFRDVIGFLDLHSQLARFLKIPVTDIVNFDNYWDLDETQQQLSVGVSIDYSACGLKTLLQGVCCFPLEGEQMGSLAYNFATRLKTEAVIGDYTYPNPHAQDRALVYFPTAAVPERLPFGTPLIMSMTLSLPRSG